MAYGCGAWAKKFFRCRQRRNQNGLHNVVCTLALNYFRLLSVYLAPVVPSIAQRGLALFWTADAAGFGSGRRENTLLGCCDP